MRSLALVALLLAAMPAQAGTYSWTDASGRRHFSDRPPTSANDVKKVEPGRLNVIANPAFNLAKLRLRVPFTERGGHLIVAGRINGVALQFIVDTGASLVVVPPAIARRAGISTRTAPQMTLQTAGGTVVVPRVILDEVAVGDIKRHGVAAVVHKVAADDKTGLLGMNFLAAYRMSVDRDAGVLVLEPVR